MTPPEIEAYLRAATRGLRGQQRAQVWAELEEDLLERAWAHQLAGRSEGESIDAALAQLGPSRTLQQAFVRQSLLGPALRWTALAGMMFSVLMWPSTRSLAQVQTSDLLPTPSCLHGAVHDEHLALPCSGSGPWLDVESLRRTLSDAGVVVDRKPYGLSLRFPQGRTVVMPTALDLKAGQDAAHRTVPLEQLTSDRYVLSRVFINALIEQSGLPVQLHGWKNPTLQIGQTHLMLGTPQTAFNSYGLYIDVLLDGLNRAGRSRSGTEFHTAHGPGADFPVQERHVLKVQDVPGAVYGVVTRVPSGGIYLDVAPTDAAGTVALTLLWHDVTFVSDQDQLTPDARHPEWQKKALLVRFTGHLNQAVPSIEMIVPRGSRSVGRAQ